MRTTILEDISHIMYLANTLISSALTGTMKILVWGDIRHTMIKQEKRSGYGVYHNKEWVCLIKPTNDLLVMHRLRFAQEIRGTEGLVVPKADVKPDEIKMAAMLINQLTKPFKPETYRDEYSEKLLQIIEAKAKGKKSTYKPMKVVHSATEDLMQKLKASLKSSPKKAAS